GVGRGFGGGAGGGGWGGGGEMLLSAPPAPPPACSRNSRYDFGVVFWPPTGGAVRSPAIGASFFTCRSYSYFSIAAASSLVSTSRGMLAGRSTGVIVATSYMPCRSGLPSGVRDIVQALAAGRAG